MSHPYPLPEGLTSFQAGTVHQNNRLPRAKLARQLRCAVLAAFLQGVAAEAEHRIGIDLDMDDGWLTVPHGLVHCLGGVSRLGRQVAIATAQLHDFVEAWAKHVGTDVALVVEVALVRNL